MKNEIIIFENQNVKLEVNIKDENVWLTLEQMSELFDRDKSVISRHVKNIIAEGELEFSTIAKFATVQKEGKRQVSRDIDYYNLDMIISVGYRVKSKNGIIFRRWANKILKDYMLKGYAVNNKRLEYLEKTVKLIDIANRTTDKLNNTEATEILKVIGEYSKALDMLDEYDYKVVNGIKGKTKSEEVITYDDCLSIIRELKFNEKSKLFALERDEGLKSILGNIYQTYGGKDVYETLEEKASNLLYMLVKNHVFIDGNKRIAATLFIYFLFYYDLLYKGNNKVIDNNTLVALTILIAESNPKEKDVIVELIMKFLLN